MQEKKVKSQRTKKIITIILAIILSFFGGYFSRYIFQPKEINTSSDLISIIENFGYILDQDGNVRDFTEDDYARAISNGLLDEYSRYFSKQEYNQRKEQQKGNHLGFGFVLSAKTENPPQIISVVGNSPADIAGVKANDLILSATKTSGEKTDFSCSGDLMDYLSACTNELIDFLIFRNGSTFNLQIEKCSYKKSYVEYFDNQRKMSILVGEDLSEREILSDRLEILDDNTALIKLTNFEGGAAEQFKFALSYMKNKGRTKLILDLRDNGGGYMDVLGKIAGNLIYNGDKKTLIAYAVSKTDTDSFYSKDRTKHDFISKIAVIANDGTASASECLIGAMLYYQEKFSLDNLVIEKNSDGVAKTFGKGIMQTTYLLQNGGAFKLTTALIYQPDKLTCIHKKGILPKPENAVEKGVSAVTRAMQTLN